MKRFICLLITILMLTTQVFAATYYNVEVEGLTYSEKEELIDWLDDEDIDYDVESYTSSSSNKNNSSKKELVVEELTNSEKNTLINWLKNRDYDYTTKVKNGDYYVTIEYTSSTKKTLINYLDDKDYYYDYDDSDKSSSYDRTGKAYLVSNGYLWYVDGDDIEQIDSIYSEKEILFTKDGAICYINKSKYGMVIEDIDDPTDTEKIATSVKSITTKNGYAYSFKSSGKTIKIDLDDADNEEVAVYIAKTNTLYVLSEDNELDKLKSLKSISGNYSGRANIGFSEWGDLVLIDSSDVCYYNESVDDIDEFEILKDQEGRSVRAKYFTIDSDGIIQKVVLMDGTSVTLEDD